MARKNRIWYPGAIYHVMSRGNRRTILYRDSSDYIQFLDYIYETKKKYDFKIHSLCLMTNHFHMLIETIDVEPGKIMHSILHPYSMYYNLKYAFSGHLFEKRYTSCIVENEKYFLEVSRYIHLNPVKAAIVNHPLEYMYSSYCFFVHIQNVQDTDNSSITECITDKEGISLSPSLCKIKSLIETSRVLSDFEGDAFEQYTAYLLKVRLIMKKRNKYVKK